MQEDPSIEVSVFKLTAASAQDARLVAARNGVKRLRMGLPPPPPAPLASSSPAVHAFCACFPPHSPRAPTILPLRAAQLRHPNVLAYKDSLEVEPDKPSAG